MKKLFCCSVLFLNFVFNLSPALAQSLPAVINTRIDSLFTSWNSDKTPGAVITVIKQGEILYQRAYGMADIAKKKPLTPRHQFWVASMAKQFTAMSIALLAEKGKLKLEDDIRKYLPELPALPDTVRIRHLIHHTSGLRDGFTLIGLTLKGERHYTNRNVLHYLTKQQSLNYKPGDRYEYNNGGYVLLAEIVARASGRSFAEFTRENIFQPLGMMQTSFTGKIPKNIPQLATGYGVKYRQQSQHYYPHHFKGNTVGSSGLITTAEDLAKWDANFYQNKLGAGNPELIKLITTGGRLNNGRRSKYAFGLEVADYNGYLAVSHSGADPGYKAEMVRFPEQQVTVICLANADNVYSLTPKLLQVGEWVIRNKIIPPVPATVKSELPENLTGYYLNPRNNADLRVITRQGSELFAAQSLEGYKAPLVPIGQRVFQNQGLKEYELHFWQSEGEQVMQLQYVNPREDTYTLEKVEPVNLTVPQLKAYAGKYYCPELDQGFRLAVKKGQLGIRLFGVLHIPFRPLAGNRFLADLMGNNCLVFTADRQENITGFGFNRDGITNLAFLKVK
jgi:CubicO group peptidase (beta-lactamase class C family)